MAASRRTAAGFTLIEVLVALMLMAVLAGMAWQGIDGIARARAAGQSRVEQTLRLNTVLAQWEQDLQSLYDTPVVPALAFDGATLRLVRRQAGGVQVVAWARHGQRWQRWGGPVVTQPTALQDSWLVSQQLLGNEPAQLSMEDGLTGWQLYFFRGNTWSNAQSSADVAAARVTPVAGTPPTAARAQLPTGVRIMLTFEGDGLTGTLTRDVLLGPQSP